ncbi:helix-turn-helix transcriptional regulator [Streptomyces griseorubiginosus]|uniref:helix-turn-helix transcriptional regulator n=1 Tax=Streptomyces griseorubiginosus TaxID=67304 RepID=UPI001AD77870|nr:helix-turn-helix transcriptional regulator [Streptomyces griseorubiginosus]MBO4253866.1 helix-turn-helix domain-containing protein [Streptomyces griseorubiginosus]
MQTLTFDSDDLARTEEFLSRAYAKMRIGNGSQDRSRARISRGTLGPVTVDELDLDFDMSYSVTPLGRICLCLVHEGTIQDHRYQGVEDAFGPGDVVSFAPPELPYAGRICSARYNITMLDPDVLSQVAAGGGSGGAPVRLTGHRPYSPAAAQRLAHTIAYLRDHVLADSGDGEHPLIVSTAAQHLAATVLATFPNTAVTDPTPSDRLDAHPVALRRALSYMDDHADEPLTVADIAAAAHVTVRALQYAFRRHLDTTPLAHLRRIRLAHAHQELTDADPTRGATVTDVAARWGFHHPGRFATLYRQAYGRSPQRTLRDG